MSLKQSYRETIQPKLLKDLNLSNVHEVPKVLKVTINRGLGEAAQNAKALEASIRAGMPIGVAVTLRGDRMYAFLERLINLALPRIRDFRGVSPKSFDGRGNYTLGIREQIIFPEISVDKIDAEGKPAAGYGAKK